MIPDTLQITVLGKRSSKAPAVIQCSFLPQLHEIRSYLLRNRNVRQLVL